jgi:antirestriction protein ArdC
MSWTKARTKSHQALIVTFRTGGERAFYSPQLDIIQLPPDVAFP